MAHHELDDPTGPVPSQTEVDEAYADVEQARLVEREVAEQTYKVAADRLPRRVQGIARTEAARVARRIGLIGAVLAALLSVAIAVAAYSTATGAARTATTTQQALERLDQANDTLTARGQVPVPAPERTDDPTETISAAVLAQVLAALPPSPTADEVATRIQSAVVAQVLGPSMDELTRQVAAYLEANPPEPGPAPTEQQILAAVERVYAENPPRDGVDGVDGQSPPCLNTPTRCQGADGTDGADGIDGQDGVDGRSILTGPEPVRLDNGDCVWRSTYDREPLVVEYPAGNAACPGGGPLGLGG